MMKLARSSGLRLAAALVAGLLLGAWSGMLSTREWQVLERETPLLARAAGAAAGGGAACRSGDPAKQRQAFYDFVLRYDTADAAAKQLETFELAEAAARHGGCDRSLLARDDARARAARARIEPILRAHHF